MICAVEWFELPLDGLASPRGRLKITIPSPLKSSVSYILDFAPVGPLGDRQN